MNNAYSYESQSIHMDHIINARELGGYRMADGRTVKHGLLLRGGSLNKASERDIFRLKNEFNVKYIFDFRSGEETGYAPDKEVEGAMRMHLPALDPETGKKTATIYEDLPKIGLEQLILNGARAPRMQEYARTIYSSMVVNEYTQLQYATFLQTITEMNEGAVYWHCSQGKDRTGLGAALLLAALGADRDTIIADFSISAEYYREVVDRLSQQVDTEAERNVIRTLVGVNTDYFIESLDIIDKEYGSMRNYLASMLVITDADMERLRSRLLE